MNTPAQLSGCRTIRDKRIVKPRDDVHRRWEYIRWYKWYRDEPPKWRLISWIRWRLRKPKEETT